MKLVKLCLLPALVLAGLSLISCEKNDPDGGVLGEEKDKAKIIFVNATPNSATQPAAAQREIAIFPYYNNVQFNNFPDQVPLEQRLQGFRAWVP
jgi:hypothetical protein